ADSLRSQSDPALADTAWPYPAGWLCRWVADRDGCPERRGTRAPGRGQSHGRAGCGHVLGRDCRGVARWHRDWVSTVAGILVSMDLVRPSVGTGESGMVTRSYRGSMLESDLRGAYCTVCSWSRPHLRDRCCERPPSDATALAWSRRGHHDLCAALRTAALI